MVKVASLIVSQFGPLQRLAIRARCEEMLVCRTFRRRQTSCTSHEVARPGTVAFDLGVPVDNTKTPQAGLDVMTHRRTLFAWRVVATSRRKVTDPRKLARR
jgi:hypothetical protein